MIDTIEITYDLDRSAYVALLRKRLFRNPRLIRIFIAVLLVGGLFYATGQPYFGLPFTITLSLGILMVLWRLPARWVAGQPHLTEHKTLRITRERLLLETPSVKTELPWTYFIAWNESDDYFMLDLTPSGCCSAIPKSSMTAEQMECFREWASATLPKYPKRLKRV